MRALDANDRLLRDMRIRVHANRSRAQHGCDGGAGTRLLTGSPSDAGPVDAYQIVCIPRPGRDR
jgi:hypothetical protein